MEDPTKIQRYPKLVEGLPIGPVVVVVSLITRRTTRVEHKRKMRSSPKAMAS